jgi:hypothetical protein
MDYPLIMIVVGVGMFVLLMRIDHGISKVNRNLEQIASLLQPKS